MTSQHNIHEMMLMSGEDAVLRFDVVNMVERLTE